MKDYKAILFDLDGTIIDTEKLYRKSYKETLSHFGFSATTEQLLGFRSLGKPFIYDYFKSVAGNACTVEEFVEYRNNLTYSFMEKEGVEKKPGADLLLSFLQEEGYKRAIVTASSKEYAVKHLSNVRLLDYFDTIISAKMVEVGKPGPEVYSFACKEIGENPKDCLAIEDSPNGVKSANSAGCDVIMVPDLSPATEEDRSLVVKVYKSLDEIIGFLKG